MPFFVGAGVVICALLVLYAGRRSLGAVDAPETLEEREEITIEELETAGT